MIGVEMDEGVQATLAPVAKQSLVLLPENTQALLSRSQQACLVAT